MTLDLPGFADPAAESQDSFRALLDAMSRPGTIHMAGARLRPPAPLHSATAAVLLTLTDADTAVWLDEAAAAASDWLRFHTGCGLVPVEKAQFACALSMPPLDRLQAGTDEAPEGSATVVLQVAVLGEGRAYRLDGPGLRGPATLHVDGLPDDFPSRWAVNRALYPRGVDLVLCAGERLCALPRTVAVGEG